MDKLQLFLASFVVLIICLVIYVNNSINGNPQSDYLYTGGVVSAIASAYFYNNLNTVDKDCIWRVAGGYY